MYAIVSDIHSNIEALEAVLRDIEAQGVKEIICLGDIIGYGPSPVECVDLAMETFVVSLSGNHEWAIVNQPLGFKSIARRAAEWHQKVLKPGWFTFSSKKRRRWEFLKNLPTKYERDGILFVHASPRNHREEYILRHDVDEVIGEFSQALKEAFQLTPWVCFIGHTHTPGVIFEDQVHFFSPEELNMEVKLEPGRKAIINVGSVGQPRDRNPKSCYVIVDGDRVYYRRVDYDVEKTQQKILANPYLDDELAHRLKEGR